MSSAEFLFEIYSEEIPARFQKAAQEQFLTLFTHIANEQGLHIHTCLTFSTPNRLILKADLERYIPEDIVEKRGPKVGCSEKALQGFCQSAGINEKDLKEKNGYYCAILMIPPRSAQELLPQVMNQVIEKFSWPKTMRYPQSPTPWVRPVRHLLSVYDGTPFEFTVSLNLKTTGYTYGHRFLSPHAIDPRNFKDYTQKLEEAFVILDAQERQKRIIQNLNNVAKEKGVDLIPDEDLLLETAGLVEYPGVFMGSLDPNLFNAPEVVITTSMRYHQKCFAFRTKEGNLAPYFAAIVNTIPKDGGKAMAKGYEMGMLKARLEDARFFYEQDLKTPLEDHTKKLDTIIFHEKLGTLGDKVRRLKDAASAYAPFLDVDGTKLTRALMLSKSDLLTHMVGEFAELQGVMGEIYAKAQGEDQEVATALREYYLPAGAEDALPVSLLGTALSLLDKMDTLVGFIGHGILPTGSKDPFALRRACLGVIRILLKAPAFDLQQLITATLKTYESGSKSLAPETQESVVTFFLSRLHFALKDQEFPHDVIEACLPSSHELLKLPLILEKVTALTNLLKTEHGRALKAGFKRTSNILETERKKDNLPPQELYLLDVNLLAHPAEKALYGAYLHVERMWEHQNTTQEQCALLATLKPAIDGFFTDIMVNDENSTIRQNRLGLLEKVTYLFDTFANFRTLEG